MEAPALPPPPLEAGEDEEARPTAMDGVSPVAAATAATMEDVDARAACALASWMAVMPAGMVTDVVTPAWPAARRARRRRAAVGDAAEEQPIGEEDVPAAELT